MQLFHVGVVVGLGQHLGDDPAWPVMRIPRSAQRRSIRLSREAVLSISRRWDSRTSTIIFSRASQGKTEDVRIGAVLIIARPASNDDRSESLVKAAGRGIRLVHLKK
jgi:hypothetical protein